MNADIAAQHDAERLVYASPCPRCGKHHPQIVKWAGEEKKKAKRRRIMRRVSTVGSAMVAIVMSPALVWVTLRDAKANVHDAIMVVGMMGVSALLVYVPFGLWREYRPVPPAWSVAKRKPDTVEFLKENPYRGAHQGSS